MRENAPVKISGLNVDGAAARRSLAIVKGNVQPNETVRVSPGGYFAALFLLSFAAGFLSYLQQTATALSILGAAWLIIPPLAWFDRITFDGENLRRTGLIPRLWRIFTRQPQRLKIADVERIETHTVRVIRGGGRVFYRYRSEVCGGSLFFAFASGGAAFRRMVRRLFPLVAEDKLDARSIELRDYLIEPAELNRKIKELQIPSSEVLENTTDKFLSKNKSRGMRNGLQTVRRGLSQMEGSREDAAARALQLFDLAIELRISGNLRQALEAFRRALVIEPENERLLFEFARGLHSYASARGDDKLLRRSLAALRLAARRAPQNARLQARIGESWFQYGENARATKAFQHAAEIEADNFRAILGLAEIALSDGKLAHVVHHFRAATRVAKDEATRIWARSEADYFALLNDDDEYMEAELTRINWLHSAQNGGRICLRLALAGLTATFFGVFFDDLITQIGLAVAAATTVLWMILNILKNFLLARSAPLDEIEDDED